MFRILPRGVVVALVVLIGLGWAVNLIVGFVAPGRADPAINGLFALVIGAVFTLQRPEKPAEPPSADPPPTTVDGDEK